MKGLVKTLFASLIAVVAVASVRAQAPAPAIPAPPSTNRPSFFRPPGAGSSFTNIRSRTNFPGAFPSAPGARPAAPAAPVAAPAAPTIDPGTTVISPRPGGLFDTNKYAGVPTNVVPKGLTNEIPAGMIRWQELDLSQVLEFYADLTRRTILKSPQVPANVKISVRNTTSLSLKEGVDAINTILGLNGIVMVEQGEKFVKAVPSSAAGPEAVTFTTNRYDDLPDSKKIVAQIVQLKAITPEEVTGIIQPFANLQNSIIAVKGSPVLILRDYAENVKRMLEIIEKVDILYDTTIENVVIPIKYALANDVANVLSGLTAGGSTVSFGSSGGAGGGGFAGGGMGGMGTMGGMGAGGMGSSFGGGMGGMGGMSGNRMGGNSSYGGGSQYGGGARPLGATGGSGAGAMGTSRSGFSGRLGGAVQRAIGSAGGGGAGDITLIGQAKIIADERSNALLVFADRRDLPMITNIISKLDVVLPQVMIEALILEVNLGMGHKMDVSMSQNKQENGKLTTAGGSVNGGFLDPNNLTSLGSFLGAGTNGGGAASSGFSYFGKYGVDFDIAVTAAANDSRFNVLSRPRIQTSTAQAASIFVGEQRPFISGSSFGDYGGISSRSQYALQDIGISLNVQPIVNQDGLVTMTIAQEISQVGGLTKIDNNEVPITIRRSANAYVSVHDRDTIVLGGFISTDKSKSTAGIPYLKDIPGLGVLFRSSSENTKRVELMVLIRPTVLPTPEAAAMNAARERDLQPNIKRAEREEEEFQQKQLEKERREAEKAEKRRYNGK